jgi:cyclohexanecarboxylate-CoA ligase
VRNGTAGRLELGRARVSASTAARYRASGYWRAETVLDDLHGWAESRPDAAALVVHRADGTARPVPFAELRDTVRRYARGLRALGIGPGEVVSTWLPNRVELAALMLATWRVGAAVSPMMPAFGPREVEPMMARAGSRVCVTVDTAGGVGHAASVAAMAARLPALRHQLVLGTPGPGQRAVAELDAAGDTEPDVPAVAADAPSIVMFTSGTTGEAKAVVHSLNTLGSHWLSSWHDHGFGPGTVAFTPQSLSHALGLSLFLMSVRHGGTAVVMERWDPGAALALMSGTGTAALVAVPVFLDQLLDHPGGDRAPRGLRHVILGGTSPSREVVGRAAERWGLVPRNQWGMTEGASIYNRPDEPADGPPECIGRPASGQEVELRGDPGEPVTAERPGRLWVRGPTVCLATAGRDGGPVRVLAEHDEGWYDTGDLASRDDRGRFRLHGRAADRVGAAFMIPVATVEDALREHPAVADVALIETHERDEPVPCAVVIPAGDAPPPGLDRLRAFLLDQGMTEFYLPRRLEIVPSLPRNSMGKVRKALLRDRYDTRPAPAPGAPPQLGT